MKKSSSTPSEQEELFPAMQAVSGNEELDRLRYQVVTCTRCPLSQSRCNAVFGEGSATAPLMFVGEAPGANEDASGMPFIGRAGQFLDKALNAHGIPRNDVFISNIVKCRPPENRDPLPQEIATCSPYLLEQIRLINPQVICALGRHAAATLLGRPVKIMQEHGQWLRYQDRDFLIVMHPSAAMRSIKFRAEFEKDIEVLAGRYRQVAQRSAER